MSVYIFDPGTSIPKNRLSLSAAVVVIVIKITANYSRVLSLYPEITAQLEEILAFAADEQQFLELLPKEVDLEAVLPKTDIIMTSRGNQATVYTTESIRQHYDHFYKSFTRMMLSTAIVDED